MQFKRVRIRRESGEGSSRRVRQVVAFVGLLMALFATLALIITVRTLSVSANVGNGDTHHHAPVVVHPTESTLQATGIRYGHPTSPPKISKEQAIQIVKAMNPELANEATQINAQYVLFSDDNYYRVDAQGQNHYFFQNVPAWVISFEGLNLGSHGPPPIKFNHELNVAINAQTGEYMEEFSYR